MTPLLHIIEHTLREEEVAGHARQAEAVLEVIRAYFQSGDLVHINMMHGALAKPTHAQIMHLYPAFGRAVALLNELIDIEGPQPGTHAWGQKVKMVLHEIDV